MAMLSPWYHTTMGGHDRPNLSTHVLRLRGLLFRTGVWVKFKGGSTTSLGMVLQRLLRVGGIHAAVGILSSFDDTLCLELLDALGGALHRDWLGLWYELGAASATMWCERMGVRGHRAVVEVGGESQGSGWVEVCRQIRSVGAAVGGKVRSLQYLGGR